MPNWCSNTLTVHGSTEDVMKFFEDNKGLEVGENFGLAAGETIELLLSFERALPTPRNEDGTLIGEGMTFSETEGLPNYWYDWRVQNWGTKWDACETFVEHSNYNDNKRTLVYNFETAWAPPVEWLETVAPNYPTLSIKIEYREEGVGFEGHLGFYNGQEVERMERELYGAHSGVEAYEDLYGS